MFDQNAPIQVGNRPESSRPPVGGSHAAAEKTGPIVSDHSPHGFPTQATPGMHPGTQTTSHAQFRRQRQADEQNLPMGFLFGLAAAMIGASLWAVITALSGWQIGFMAIGVGWLAGQGVRLGGKGTDQSFAFIGAGLALLGCLFGNLLTSCWFIAQANEIPFGDVLSSLNGAAIGEIFNASFNPIDLLFYGLAVWTGFKYARIEEETSAPAPKA